MPRPNLGPKLVVIRKEGWTRSMFYIRWTEGVEPSCTERVSMPPILTRLRHTSKNGSRPGRGRAAMAPASPIRSGSRI
jgi:hypothetical protein